MHDILLRYSPVFINGGGGILMTARKIKCFVLCFWMETTKFSSLHFAAGQSMSSGVKERITGL